MKASNILPRLGMWVSFAFGVVVDLGILHAVAARYRWGNESLIIADGIVVITLLLVLLERATYEAENTKNTSDPVFLLSLIANSIVFAIAPVFLPILLGLYFLRASKR